MRTQSVCYRGFTAICSTVPPRRGYRLGQAVASGMTLEVQRASVAFRSFLASLQPLRQAVRVYLLILALSHSQPMKLLG